MVSRRLAKPWSRKRLVGSSPSPSATKEKGALVIESADCYAYFVPWLHSG